MAGNINDVFKSQLAGELNGARAAADTAYVVFASEPGVYASRTIWIQGTGAGNIKWKSQKPDGTEVLLNDLAEWGIKNLPPGYHSFTDRDQHGFTHPILNRRGTQCEPRCFHPGRFLGRGP